MSASIRTATCRGSPPTSTTTTWPSGQGRDRRLQCRRQRHLRQQQGRVRHDQLAERLAGRDLADPLQGRVDAVRPDGGRDRRQPPAGAVRLRQAQHPGLRVEYRDETYKIKAGETASWVNGGNGKGAGAQGFPGFRPTNAVDVSRNATSLYVDLDNQITDKLDIDLAARYEDYSDFGSTTTGKIAARYDFTDSFALRGAFSSGFRAPALQQQYFTTTSINIVGGAAVDVGTFPATSATAAALGAKPLEPEKSKNYSLGAVYHKGPFELTVDAYQIDIDNRIVLSENIAGVNGGTPTQQAIYNLLQPFGVTTARFFVNGVDTTTKGVDVVGRYRLDADAAGRFDLTLAANFNQTDVTQVPTTSTLSGLPVPPPLFARVNVLTYEEGTPDHKFVASGDWSNGPWGATLKGTAYGSVLVPNATRPWTTSPAPRRCGTPRPATPS
jgi:iron complex outermembrane receptor protein